MLVAMGSSFLSWTLSLQRQDVFMVSAFECSNIREDRIE